MGRLKDLKRGFSLVRGSDSVKDAKRRGITGPGTRKSLGGHTVPKDVTIHRGGGGGGTFGNPFQFDKARGKIRRLRKLN